MTDDLTQRLREGDHFEKIMSAPEAADRIEADAKRIAELVAAANQARLALAGYVSAQSAINMLDAALGEKKGEPK